MMAKLSSLEDFNSNVYIKENIKAKWKESTREEVLENMLEETTPFDAETKRLIPAFGFNKLKEHTSNAQQYPTRYVILELDTPSFWKTQIAAGNKQKQQEVAGIFWTLYCLFHYDSTLDYFWLYLTPSTRGLRFVLKTDIPVVDEQHYRQVVKQFLRILYRKTNGGVNPAFFDIRVNQAWYVPTFLQYFSPRENCFSIEPLRKENKEATKRLNQRSQPFHGALGQDKRLNLAIRFTERNLSFQKGQRNNYIYQLACNCNRLGLAESVVSTRLIDLYDLDEPEIARAIRSAYRHHQAEFGSLLKQ